MKLSKLSNKVRWILVLPAIVIVFFCVGNLFGRLFGWSDSPTFVMCGLFTFLTGITIAPLHGKRFVTVVVSVFIISCLFPPWQNTDARFHNHAPAGYSLIFDPPTNPDRNPWNAVQIDFGRLFLEWAAFVPIAGLIYFLVSNRRQTDADRKSAGEK